MYRKILVPLDGSELAECVLQHVEAMARAGGVESVMLVRVAEPFDLTPVRGEQGWFTEEEVKKADAGARAVAQDYLDRVAGQLNLRPVSVQKEVLEGRAAPTLADYANKNNVDLVVVATHGRSGVSRWVMGSVADRLVRSVHAPVLIVRPPACIPGS